MKSIFIILFIILGLNSLAQNLVNNGDFENLNNCPPNIGLGFTFYIDYANGWDFIYASPDIFHTCGSLGGGVPNTAMGYQQPYSGQSFAGFAPWHLAGLPPSNYREGIITELNDTMQIGTTYYCSFKLNNSGYNNLACNRVGMQFSKEFYQVQPFLLTPLPNKSYIYSDVVTLDTANWVHIQGEFTADSAYRFLSLTNFFDNLNTTVVGSTFGALYPYYFVDDVCVSTNPLDCGYMSCSTSYDSLNITVCDSFVSPSYRHKWYSSGIYRDTLKTNLGCDSIITFNLTISSSYYFEQNLTICAGDSVLIYGQYEYNSGVFYDSTQTSYQTINGCDSLYFITLVVKQNPATFLESVAICQGDSALIHGVYYFTPTISRDTLQTIEGCDSIHVVDLIVRSLPLVFVSPFNPDTVCLNSPIINIPSYFPANGSFSGNGVGVGNDFNPSIAGIGTHNIVYTYTDQFSCTNTDTVVITVVNCTGITEVLKEFGISIYPNPNNGVFIIEKLLSLNKEVQIKLLDASSKLIIHKTIPIGKQKIEMDITNYSNGVYYLQLIVDDEVFVKQILKD